MLSAQVIETNGVSSLVVKNSTNGKSATIPGVSATASLAEARAAFKIYLDAVKRSRMLERTLEGEFATGKTKDSEEAKEQNVKENRERMALHLAIIFQNGELELIQSGLIRIQLEAFELLGQPTFERVMNARRNVPKLADELLTEFFDQTSASVEITGEITSAETEESFLNSEEFEATA
jgi:hypothetical protein